MKINGNEIPKQVLAKAIACETPEELIKLAKEYGVDLTAEEARAYLDELDNIDITSEQLKAVAGGMPCPDKYCFSEKPCIHKTDYWGN